MEWDALLLSRLQFAFTIGFHIIFPAFTIGLASFLAVLEGLWLLTKRAVFKNLYLFWVKIFALSFGMGVVSGVVMSYQFGTNWSVFSAITGSVIGPLLAYEVLTAFFLEASFLGIMLFGWKRVGPGLHFFSTCMVAIGTLFSAFWILSANSWMQTPQGWAWAEDGTMVATNFAEVIFNPSLPSRFAHMVLAAFLTTAMVVAGASAFALLRKKALAESRVALRMAVLMMALVTPVQIMAGHESGIVAGEHQPAKVAALEGWWTTRTQQPTVLIGWPDEEAERNHFELVVPGLGSVVNNAESEDVLPGLDQFAAEDRPPVWITFWAFRIMVGMGLVMLTLGIWGAGAWALKRLDAATWYHRALVLAAPSGFVAVLTGWITAEAGRQPFVVYGVLRTADAVSPVPAGSVATSLLFFIVVYSIVFSAGALYILRLIAKGPESDEPAPQSNQPPGTPLGAAIEEAP
ncbi:cytochrome ubiquinol oxidase subunit I [Candidatus Viadribacter manganicus]|uniref:Cytochrome D ubiquinol oxidase subunit I n=1 Tax=Candidatus Viadribacter manganicus TaxID=1759059 RepID=A0A1B1AHV6_9PROT|nr:cytochrome ubiquinol oxidase subunit I [Candidatus Viadribacter manganicus]ANP46137.1 cytochrome D ubiquinol oxidase subunit I [Candidatus Viadribacter manganicus]